jgi:hypothetical protein
VERVDDGLRQPAFAIAFIRELIGDSGDVFGAGNEVGRRGHN